MNRPRLSWDKAPSWATVLLKNKDDPEDYVFAEGFKNNAKGWPSLFAKEHFQLVKECWELIENRPLEETSVKEEKPEDSGGSCEYYRVHIPKPTTAISSYVAECNDVIETLGMTYAEANMFKEIWRSAAARTLGRLKAGHSEQRGAEKIEFFAKRNSIQKGVKQ